MYSQFVVCPRRQNVVSFVKDTRDTAQQQLGIGSAHTQYVRRWWRQAGQRAPAAPPAYHSPERVPETTECIGAPTGEWKGVTGWALTLASLSVWIYFAMKIFATVILSSILRGRSPFACL
ncbi:unnamed protein product [Plutella xylostella]|uniref:(diamondback moth) hypothetical protein n=1 Tax=Plutella xylostella TaxID=51655 RepID=A0A8S4G3P8_PLUXY|nr:unnamed protein product [Plutella xylostella]